MEYKFSRYNIFIKKRDDDNYYLFNTNSGATFLVDDDVKTRIESENFKSFSEEELDDYERTGIIIDKQVDENKVFSYFYNKRKFNNDVLNLTVLLTYECNLRCIYCYEGAGEAIKGSLDNKTRNSIFNFIKKQLEARRSKVLSMVLFGGEPLLDFSDNYDWLDQIKEYCENNGVQFVTSIVTNGILINEEIMERLESYHCEMIQITLDGLKSIHDTRRIYKDGRGSFDEVMRGIRYIYNNPNLEKPVIRINIDKNNIQDVKELLKYLSDEGLNECFIDFGIVKGTTNACSSYTGNCFVEEELGEILDNLWDELELYGFAYNIRPQHREIFCGLFCDASYTISPFGEIYKCWDHVGMKEHLMGKINEEGEQVDTTYQYIDWMTHNPIEVKECSECKYLPSCGGGCASVSYSKDKTYHSNGCYKVKGVVEKQVERLFMKGQKAEQDA